ncbi:MAG TPA: murein biosynthesis integral membrane protein MurJ [Vicinamibacterales bacterium]
MSSRLARSAGLISVATMASRLLGVAREIVLARLFGASADASMDAFNVAFRVPNLVRDLFAEGAMTAAFVPTFTRVLNTRGRDAAWRLGNLVINALVVVTAVLVLVGIVFAEPITRVIASGEKFASIPGKLQLTTQLTEIMMPFLTTIAVAVAMMGMLNSLHRFFVPALSPAMFNVATILCAFLLVPVMQPLGLPPIAAIAIATVLGGIGQIAVQWPVLRAEGFRYRPVLDFRDPDVREILRLMGPATLGLAAVQINVLVNTSLATTEPQGAVSWLQYAFRLMYLPIGLFGVSIATAALPHISKQAVDADKAGIRGTISAGLRMMLMLNVPATVGLMVLAYPIVELVLEYGKFAARDTSATAAALMFYAPGLLGYSAVKIASPSFYAMGDSRTPVVVSVSSVAVNLVLNIGLVRVMGYRGLALGTAIAAVFNAGVLLVVLRQRLEGLDGRRVGIALVKILAASALMGVAAHYASGFSYGLLPGHAWYVRMVRVFGTIAAAVLVLAASARLLRIQELSVAMDRVLGRFVRR